MTALTKTTEWALITGGPRGFCETIARTLTSEGYSLVVQGRNKLALGSFADKLRSESSSLVVPISIDAKETNAAALLVEKLSELNIIPRVIVHHLGGPDGVKSSLAPIEDWLRVLQLNVLFSINFNRLMINKLRDLSYARIVNIGSVSGSSFRGSGPYACAKALLSAYTKTVGRELGRTNITVSYLSLGAFLTENSNWARYKDSDPKLVSDFIRHHQAAGRLGEPEEIDVVIRMLVSQKFSFGQGAIIEYDGGTM